MDPYLRAQLIMEMHGIFFSAAVGCTLLFNKDKKFQGGHFLIATLFVTSLILLSDVMTWLTQGGTTPLDTVAVRVSNFTLYAFQLAIICLMTSYFYRILRTKNSEYSKKSVYIVYGMCIIGGILLLITPFTGFCYTIDAANIYVRGPGFLAEIGLGGAACVVTLTMVFQNRRFLTKEEFAGMLSYYLFPLIGLVIQLFVFGYSFMNIGILISVIIAAIGYHRSLRRESERKDLLLLKSQAYLLNSQIKPHFLFNSLNIIQSLIEEDPDTAIQAVGHFSKYLRSGLKVDVMDALVPLQQELDYVDNYLYLEQLRHGERLQIIRDIEPGIDFEIPFLTIQPLVENAVRHGVCKKVHGGTVAIDIHSEDEWNVIRIVDDGVGFYPLKREVDTNLKPDSGAGVGARNVEERVRMMCGGVVDTDSEPGKGTMVTIRMPKKGKKEHDISGS